MENLPISPIRVPLCRSDLRKMLALLRISWKLQESPVYRQEVAAELPEVARFDPGYRAVLMGYDFHLSSAGPRLIEVNTNAGGAAFALEACHGEPRLTASLKRRLLQMFQREWSDFAGRQRALSSIVIVDEKPQEQALYSEMQRYVEWFSAAGIQARIADPHEINNGPQGLELKGMPIDMIYNRHCDFYLEEDAQGVIRDAYLAGQVCLTPNPFVYGHLADKRRLVPWCQAERMASVGLEPGEIDLLQQIVPESHLLSSFDKDSVWQQRKTLVFKPVDRFGGKGVLLGRAMSRKRFEQFDPELTLVQELVPPSQIEDASGSSFKLDIRLYAWRRQGLGVAARLYQGQVTNLQTEGGGFAAVDLI